MLVGDIKETPREGSLMPDTYYFERGDTRQSILARMAKAQTRIVDEIWKERAPDLPVRSPGEMVTLASIVEKETGKPDERPHVASVFVNRLQKHMRLESDPTIVYGLVFGKGTLGRPISRADLNQATPYNTYVIDGLPPGPISNPGKASLEAVANPARTRDLYFVADGTGGHVFADSFDQHLKNVAHWRQVEKDAKDHLAPDAAPTAPSAIHGEIEPADPAAFGALLPIGPASAAQPGQGIQTAQAALATIARLAKIGAGRKAMDAALSSLSSGPTAGKTIEDLGAVVTGVNDGPAEGDAFADARASIDGSGSAASVPLSPTMLADQKAREAKYGMGAPRTGPVRSSRRPPHRASRPPRGGRASSMRRKAPSSIRCSTRPTTSATPRSCRRSSSTGLALNRSAGRRYLDSSPARLSRKARQAASCDSSTYSSGLCA